MSFEQTVISSSELDWRQVAPSCREMVVRRGGQRIRLVEFQQGFQEQSWCEKGHIGYVLKGELNIQFFDRTIKAQSGDFVWIPSGHLFRHRAHVPGEFVQLVLFESEEAENELDR